MSIGIKFGRVIDYVVTCRRNGALIDFLRHQEKVEAIVLRDGAVYNSSGTRILRIWFTSAEKSRADALTNNHVSNAGIPV